MTVARILVYGVTGSGKSTAATAIGARTGLPVTLVDELTWLPGWVPVEESIQRELISEVVAGERWVLDSSYGAWLDQRGWRPRRSSARSSWAGSSRGS